MNVSAPLLDALPLDSTPDAGPRHRGGPFAYVVALSCGLAALGVGISLYRQGQTLWAGLCLLVLGSLAIRAGWCLADRFRHHGSLPRSHAVLTDALGFRIHSTCRDVAATVFLEPDQLSAGSSFRLFCFLENYSSRQRVTHLRIGPHHQLGLQRPHAVALRLAAGQAAVYVLSLAAAPTLPPGEHDIPVTLKVHKPTGTGARLPGTRRHLYDLWTIHFAAPFTITEALSSQVNPTPASPSEAARFLTLASVSEKEPHLGVLETVVTPGTSDLPSS